MLQRYLPIITGILLPIATFLDTQTAAVPGWLYYDDPNGNNSDIGHIGDDPSLNNYYRNTLLNTESAQKVYNTFTHKKSSFNRNVHSDIEYKYREIPIYPSPLYNNYPKRYFEIDDSINITNPNDDSTIIPPGRNHKVGLVYYKPTFLSILTIISSTIGWIGVLAVAVRMVEKKIKWMTRLIIATSFSQAFLCAISLATFFTWAAVNNDNAKYSEATLYCVLAFLFSFTSGFSASYHHYLNRTQVYSYTLYELSVSQRQLILLSICSMSYICLTGGLYSYIEDWEFDYSIYFTVTTLSTIGFGDLAPKTMRGKILLPIVAICGISLIAGTIYSIRLVTLEFMTHRLANAFSKSFGFEKDMDDIPPNQINSPTSTFITSPVNRFNRGIDTNGENVYSQEENSLNVTSINKARYNRDVFGSRMNSMPATVHFSIQKGFNEDLDSHGTSTTSNSNSNSNSNLKDKGVGLLNGEILHMEPSTTDITSDSTSVLSSNASNNICNLNSNIFNKDNNVLAIDTLPPIDTVKGKGKISVNRVKQATTVDQLESLLTSSGLEPPETIVQDLMVDERIIMLHKPKTNLLENKSTQSLNFDFLKNGSEIKESNNDTTSFANNIDKRGKSHSNDTLPTNRTVFNNTDSKAENTVNKENTLGKSNLNSTDTDLGNNIYQTDLRKEYCNNNKLHHRFNILGNNRNHNKVQYSHRHEINNENSYDHRHVDTDKQSQHTKPKLNKQDTMIISRSNNLPSLTIVTGGKVGRIQVLETTRKAFQKEIVIAVVAIMSTLALFGGVFCYLEEWTYFEGVYFAFVALSTIGYGDYSPSSVSGRSFFVWFIFIGIGSITYFLSILSEIALDKWTMTVNQIGRRVDRYEKKAKLKKIYQKTINQHKLGSEKNGLHNEHSAIIQGDIRYLLNDKDGINENNFSYPDKNDDVNSNEFLIENNNDVTENTPLLNDNERPITKANSMYRNSNIHKQNSLSNLSVNNSKGFVRIDMPSSTYSQPFLFRSNGSNERNVHFNNNNKRRMSNMIIAPSQEHIKNYISYRENNGEFRRNHRNAHRRYHSVATERSAVEGKSGILNINDNDDDMYSEPTNQIKHRRSVMFALNDCDDCDNNLNNNRKSKDNRKYNYSVSPLVSNNSLNSNSNNRSNNGSVENYLHKPYSSRRSLSGLNAFTNSTEGYRSLDSPSTTVSDAVFQLDPTVDDNNYIINDAELNQFNKDNDNIDLAGAHSYLYHKNVHDNKFKDNEPESMYLDRLQKHSLSSSSSLSSNCSCLPSDRGNRAITETNETNKYSLEGDRSGSHYKNSISPTSSFSSSSSLSPTNIVSPRSIRKMNSLSNTDLYALNSNLCSPDDNKDEPIRIFSGFKPLSILSKSFTNMNLDNDNIDNDNIKNNGSLNFKALSSSLKNWNKNFKNKSKDRYDNDDDSLV